MKIAVLLGGTSAERDVSIASGLRVTSALREVGHIVTAVDPARGALSDADERAMRAAGVKTEPPSLETLKKLAGRARDRSASSLATLPEVLSADVVFLALHGGQGEDGTIQALLDLLDVPYTGSGHLASALAMDKDLSKLLFRAAGVATADWTMRRRVRGETRDSRGTTEADITMLGLPLVVKPSKQGSTVGLTVVKDSSALAPAVEEAFLYDDEVMLERFVAGREFTVGVLGETALPVGEIIAVHEIYDYECKYTSGMAREVFPAELSGAQTADVQALSLAAFRALKLSGYARIDFRLGDDGVFYCLEANTLPGMTELSLIPQAAVAAGMEFPALCQRIVELACSGRVAAVPGGAAR
jgi:D-alanine-D-alanine ligase